MDQRDLIVTPLVILLVYGGAYIIRRSVTDDITRVYFFPALTVKIIGALALGVIYQYYYEGGDTFNYHTHGSRHVWEAFMESPSKGLRLIFGDTSSPDLYKYSSRVVFITDPPSYMIVRIASIIDIFTFSTYSATAIVFSIFSFIGMWLLFLTFYEEYPHLHFSIAVAAFFIPSVFFWGSGLLKDTITLGCLGIATYTTYRCLIAKKPTAKWLSFLVLSLYGLYKIKIYILLTFLPAAIIWVFIANLRDFRSVVLRAVLFPTVITMSITLAYFAMVKAGEDNPKYSMSGFAKTAKITAYDIRYFSGRDAGSGYTLGELDGTFESMLTLAPSAINVSLFRPYLWEVNNPLMLLAGVESFFLLLYCVYIFFTQNIRIPSALVDADVFFSLVFSLTFAFAVGVSTFNFGSLARYKIPMLPFFLIALQLIQNRDRYTKRRSDEADYNSAQFPDSR